GFLAITGEKVGEARTHVTGQVFDDDGNGVGFWIGSGGESLVRDLCDRAFGQSFVIAEDFDGVLQVRSCELECHTYIFGLNGIEMQVRPAAELRGVGQERSSIGPLSRPAAM